MIYYPEQLMDYIKYEAMCQECEGHGYFTTGEYDMVEEYKCDCCDEGWKI